MRTAVELMSGFAAEATAGRTAGWLDQLVDAGHLTPTQRTRMAAEDGAATLARVLRRAELAGHDPRQVLHDAVTERVTRRRPAAHQRHPRPDHHQPDTVPGPSR